MSRYDDLGILAARREYQNPIGAAQFSNAMDIRNAMVASVHSSRNVDILEEYGRPIYTISDAAVGDDTRINQDADIKSVYVTRKELVGYGSVGLLLLLMVLLPGFP